MWQVVLLSPLCPFMIKSYTSLRTCPLHPRRSFPRLRISFLGVRWHKRTTKGGRAGVMSGQGKTLGVSRHSAQPSSRDKRYDGAAALRRRLGTKPNPRITRSNGSQDHGETPREPQGSDTQIMLTKAETRAALSTRKQTNTCAPQATDKPARRAHLKHTTRSQDHGKVPQEPRGSAKRPASVTAEVKAPNSASLAATRLAQRQPDKLATRATPLHSLGQDTSNEAGPEALEVNYSHTEGQEQTRGPPWSLPRAQPKRAATVKPAKLGATHGT